MAGALCPPGRPPRPGRVVLLDVPANVRARPGGRVVGVAKRSAGSFWLAQARVLGVQGSWYEVEPTMPPEGSRDWPGRGFVHASNVQPVCVVTSDPDIPAGSDGLPLVHRIQEEGALRLEAFGHQGPTIETHEEAAQYLFETGSPDFPFAYFVDSSDMGGGDLQAFGPRGFVSWAKGLGQRFGTGFLREVRPDGQIRTSGEMGCLLVQLTLRVNREGIQVADSSFGPEPVKTIREKPLESERAGMCSIRTPGGRKAALRPGEKLELLRATPDGRAIVVRRLSDGSTGLFEPGAAAVCFENQICAA